MLFCPTFIAAETSLVFLMCLFPVTYTLIDDFKFGGILSLFTFGAWLSNLVVTMHAESSWAVNAIGDIKMANLYYFSWASIITSGLQMSSYMKKLLGIKPRSILIILWLAIVKVCFVVFGAGVHIWYSINDTCDSGNTFCKRTEFATLVGLIGMSMGSLVALWHMVQKTETRVHLYVEMSLSIALLVLFGVGAFVITTIGGPGESVGDLYYATWLAFLVSLAIVKGCHDHIKNCNMVAAVQMEINRNNGWHTSATSKGVAGMVQSQASSGSIHSGPTNIPFVRMPD